MIDYKDYILSIPKSLLFNLRAFGIIKGIRLPILISYKTITKNNSGLFKIKSEFKTGLIQIGFGNVSIFDKSKRRTILQNSGELVFYGKAFIGHGSSIVVKKGAVLELGDQFTITAESKISCRKRISFGNKCLISWDVLILDNDFHKILKTGRILNEDACIILGNHNWIGAGCTILKGTIVGDNNIIGAKSLLSKRYDVNNCIIAGNPAKVIANDVDWDS